MDLRSIGARAAGATALRAAGVLLAASPAVGAGDPADTVQVNHTLAPGEVVFGWWASADGSRVSYGVQPSGVSIAVRRFFRAPVDGSQDAVPLTPVLPADRSIRFWAVDPRDQRLAIVCDLESNDRFELFSVRTDGTGSPIKLSAPLPPNEDVLTVRFTPDGSRVLYLTAVPFSGRNTLRCVPADGSGPEVVLHAPGPGVYGVLAERPTYDSRRAVCWEIPETLRSAPLDGSAPAIALSPSAAGEAADSHYQLSTDGEWIAYFGETPSGSDVFAGRVDGSSPRRPLFFPDEPGRVTDRYRITPDSRHVVAVTTDGQELRVAAIDGSQRARLLARPELGLQSDFRFARDGWIVFGATRGPDWLSRHFLYRVPLDGASKAARLFGARGAAWPIKHEVTALDRVVFVAFERNWHLFSLPLHGGAPAVRLTPPMVPGGGVDDASTVNASSFRVSPDHEWLLYVADQEQLRVEELYAVPADGSLPARKMNAPLPSGGDVVQYAFAPDSRRVLFDVWTSTTRNVFTSVIPGQSAPRRAPGEPAAAGGPVVVDDPLRALREDPTDVSRGDLEHRPWLRQPWRLRGGG